MVYSNAWKRVLAFLIDSLVILFCDMAFGILVTFSGMENFILGLPILGLWWLAGVLILPWLYYALFESSPRQATVGKQMLGLRVADTNGERIGFGKATGRYFSKFISQATFGYLLLFFSKRRQTLHDRIASTVVIEARSQEKLEPV